MKRLWAVVLCLGLCLGLCGCGASLPGGQSAYERARDNYNAEMIAWKNLKEEFESTHDSIRTNQKILELNANLSDAEEVPKRIASLREHAKSLEQRVYAQRVRLNRARDAIADYDREIQQ